jgi:hypothetical protein
MDVGYIRRELAMAAREAGMGKKKAKGAMGKIRQHAKRYGEQAFSEMLDELDGDLSRSREWNQMEADLFRTTALEAMKAKLEKELR